MEPPAHTRGAFPHKITWILSHVFRLLFVQHIQKPRRRLALNSAGSFDAQQHPLDWRAPMAEGGDGRY